MDKYIEEIKLARNVDQLEEVAEKYMDEWAALSDNHYDILAKEMSIAEEKFIVINAALMN